MREGAPRLGRRYRRLWWATAVSNLGNGVLFAAMPLLAHTITSSPAALAGVTAATSLPGLLVALHAGAVVDRLDRRRVMVAMDLSRLTILVVFSVLVITHHVPLATIYIAAFLLGAGDVTFDGAARSLLPAIVPPERLDAANGRLAAATDTMDELLGPPTAVALFALATAVPFIFDAASFAWSALLLSTILGTYRAARTEPAQSLRREIGEGLRYVRESRTLTVLAAGTGTLALFSSANIGVLVAFALDERHGLNLPRAGYGYLLMTIAIGGVAGSFLVEHLTARVKSVAVLAGATAINGAGYLLISIAHGPALATVAAVLWGFGISVGMTVSIGMRQTLTPDHLLGRVMSVFRVLVGLGGVVGALLGGVVAGAIGLRAPYVVSGLIQIALSPVFGLVLARTMPDTVNACE
jgi:MFS family permease